MSGEPMERAETRIKELEAKNKAQGAQIETLQEALDGAHRIVRQLRDRDSGIPAYTEQVPK